MAHVDVATFARQIARASPVHRHLQISLHMMMGLRSGLRLGHSKTPIILEKPLFCWFRWVLGVVVGLKDEVSLHFQLSNRRPKVLCRH